MTYHPGQQLGNYKLTRFLSRGGFAEVYLGQHIYLNTQVAIKILQGQWDDESRHNFIKEAQIIASLIHPHILRILDFGLDGEMPFMVMDYAPLGTLRDRYPRGTILPATTIVSYVKQIADALHYAHGKKLIHRDVKPENILLVDEQTVVLADFGIAAIAHSAASMRTQDASGTVHYMAPEQILGKPVPASDQYSLAVIVYEWLCGMRPFSGGTLAEISMRHISTPPPPLRQRVPTLSPEIERVVLTALAKDPAQRFADELTFVQALSQACGLQAQASTILPSGNVPAMTPVLPQSIRQEAHSFHESFPSLDDVHGRPTVMQTAKPYAPTSTRNATSYQGIFAETGGSPSGQSATGGEFLPPQPSTQQGLSRRAVLGGVGALAALAAAGSIAGFLILPSLHSSASTQQGAVSTQVTAARPRQPRMPEPSPTRVPPIHRTIVDDLNDWSKVYSHTPHLGFDGKNAQFINGDPKRLLRQGTTLTHEEVAWKLLAMTSFTAVTYFWPETPSSPFSMYTSTDGIDWTQVTPTISEVRPGNHKTGTWGIYQYTLSNLTNVNYVKMRWNSMSGPIWTPQIGKVTLKS